MAAKLSLLSLNQLQQLAQSSDSMSVDHQGGLASASPDVQWVRNHKVPEESDGSWEVRAFAEDYTGSMSGSTWPPRSYTCTFCKREFRSAQALGGHMNVHRRDRVTKRFNHTLQAPVTAIPAAASTSSAPNSTLVFPARELSNLNGGFCLLYQPPSQSNFVKPTNWVPTSTSNSYNVLTKPGLTKAASSQAYSSKIEVSSAQISNTRYTGCTNFNWNKDFAEDLDLELRLGQNPSAS